MAFKFEGQETYPVFVCADVVDQTTPKL